MLFNVNPTVAAVSDLLSGNHGERERGDGGGDAVARGGHGPGGLGIHGLRGQFPKNIRV